MRKMKKISLLLAAIMSLSLVFTACEGLPFPLGKDSSTTENSLDSSADGSLTESAIGNSFEDSSLEESASNETSDSVEESSEENEDIYDEKLFIMQQTVDLAYELSYGETMDGSYTLTGEITSIEKGTKYKATIVIEGREDFPILCYNLVGETDTLRVGDIITVWGTLKNYKGTVEFDSPLLMEVSQQDRPDASGDPYANMTESEFYASYTPATSNTDAYYRTLHGFLSGEVIEMPDQEPEIASYQPQSGGKFIRNSEMLFDESGKEYTVVDAYGNEAYKIYRDGAYIGIEEVAAFVYAFGTYPANYTYLKNADPDDSIWGEHLRLNHTPFSGSTSKYPYEPELPNISGCGGTLNYYEMDIGTTGTDCDPSYPIRIYNNGFSITRGAARIVYGKNDLNRNGVYEEGELHVFYTYNHYNDFQEYLNYEGGWGEMFGNITGGGTISSKSDYNPTDYVQVVLQPIAAHGTRSLSSFYQNYYGV